MENIKAQTIAALECYQGRSLNNKIKFTSRAVVDYVKKSIAQKASLRKMLMKHSGWDEDLQAVVLNGTRIVEPDLAKVHHKVCWLLSHDDDGLDTEPMFWVADWVTYGNHAKEVKELFPTCYNPDAKRNRVLRKILVELGRWDETAGSECQKKYAYISDSLSAKKTDFDLILSIHPAAYLTMSNPKHDERGETLTSCHSLNNFDYNYSAGCSGYGLDEITMIAFTTHKNKKDTDSLYTRKTSRQLFMYKQGLGILLQSRLYDSEGGTRTQGDYGKLLREMVQGALSECEDMPNLWVTRDYHNQKDWNITFSEHRYFGGYADFIYPDFDCRVSVRKDAVDLAQYAYFEVGACGVCLGCGKELMPEIDGAVCENCQEEL